MGIPATVNVRAQEEEEEAACHAGRSVDGGSGADDAERSSGGGSASPDLCVALNNLAALLTEQGRHAEAEAALRRALALSERTVGRW